jgi:uncharacterized protein YlaI
MDFDDQIELEHLLFFDRKCRVCNKVKSLMDDFYLTRKDRGRFPSAYSYECKECTIRRIQSKRKGKEKIEWEYPDW